MLHLAKKLGAISTCIYGIKESVMHCKCVTKYLIRNLEAVRCREE